MTFEINEGQIFIHKNTKHEGNKPVMKGTAKINGVECEIALWGSKSGKDGSYSGKIKVKEDGPKPDKSPSVPENAQNNQMDDEIPF